MREPSKLKILVVDDEHEIVSSLTRALRGEFEVIGAHSGSEALERLREHDDFALILTDQRMPGISGIDLLAHAVTVAPRAARVMLSGQTDYADVLEAINRGHVTRFLLKPFDTATLRALLRDALSTYRLELERQGLLDELAERNALLHEQERVLEQRVLDRTEGLRALNAEYQRTNAALVEANSRLSDLALRDGLTGLFNHRYLQERLISEVARARRHNHPLGLLLLDIDHFKAINDGHGHPAGDQVLRTLGRLLSFGMAMRTSDVAARYGGEEFAIILPETPVEGSLIKAEQVRKAVSEIAFESDGATLHVTVSVGVAEYPQHGADPAALLRSADQGLYRAKALGRNRVERLES